MKRRLYTFLFLLSFFVSYSQEQPKQGNTPGSEVIADAPYHMEMYDGEGNLNPIPLHVFVHHSSGLGYNNELMDITVKIKNAADNSFSTVITFDDYSVADFEELFVDSSMYDPELDIQPFWESGVLKDATYTLNFTSNYHTVPYTTYVDITHDYWWFTLLIPSDKLVGFDNIIDMEVYFGLDWDPDYVCYMRIFRYDDSFPSVEDWYRGDLHYHGMYTQNDSEVGLPLDGTKTAAKVCGLEWITVTDHSCDFDNYGEGEHQNWEQLGNTISQLNMEDSSFIYIRGIEMSINNSEGDLIHALTYPSEEDPYSLPYIGDGDGDLFPTSVNVEMLIDSLVKYDAFAYAAHPFAEGDFLSWVIDGSIWNLGHPDFPENGTAHPSIGTVACNDLSSDSDILSDDINKLIKNNIIGGQAWNLSNNLKTDGDEENAWDVFHSGSEFEMWPELDYDHHIYRLSQNMDVAEFLWKKGLFLKNSNPDAENWKYFNSAGSDAHGSFNYSTTDFFVDLYGYVTDNAIGKITTMAYCPNGMGANGENVLKALKNGNTILSSGPIVGFDIQTDTNSVLPEIYIGNDAVISLEDAQNSKLNVFSSISDEYGVMVSKRIKVFTESEMYQYDLDLDTISEEFILIDLLNDICGSGNVPINEYFIITAELQTFKEYADPFIYKLTSETFNSYTNPVWLKIEDPTHIEEKRPYISLYPNPANDEITINTEMISEEQTLEIINSNGQIIRKQKITENSIKLNLMDLKSGLYIIKIQTNNGAVTHKFIKK